VDGVPFEAHVKVNGAVPPLAEALQVTGLPAVAVPHVTVTTIGWPVTVTVVVVVMLTPLASLAVVATVWLPFVAKVVV